MVALARMTLAPGVFMRGDILSFGKIGGARIERCVQIIYLTNNPVRYAGVVVTAVLVAEFDGKVSGKRIDPGTRTQVWPRIQAGAVRVGAS